MGSVIERTLRGSAGDNKIKFIIFEKEKYFFSKVSCSYSKRMINLFAKKNYLTDGSAPGSFFLPVMRLILLGQ